MQKKFKNDNTKEFIWSGAEDFSTNKKVELSISLDVLFRLMEDEIFNEYMNQLFNSSTKYVIIYSCNYDEPNHVHVQCRKFTDWVDIKEKDRWKLIKTIKINIQLKKEVRFLIFIFMKK